MDLIRQCAERLARGRVFRRKFPPQYGGAEIFVTPECGLRYLRPNLGEVDTPLLELVRERVKTGAVVWDIGANLGLFSFAAAGLAGREGKVFSLEPDTYLVGLLRRSSRLNRGSAAAVTVIPCAVAGALALASFNIAERARASNFLSGHGAPQAGGVRETQRVLTVTLDWLATQLPLPSVIKIDTEGADLQVLQGATQLLREKQPDLICEVFDESADEVTRLLHAAGYTLFDGETPPALRLPILRAAHTTLAIAAHSAR